MLTADGECLDCDSAPPFCRCAQLAAGLGPAQASLAQVGELDVSFLQGYGVTMKIWAFSVFTILVMLLLAYGMYLIAISTDPSVAAAVITASSTIIVSTVTVTIGRYLEKKKELEAFHREQKIPIYGKFLDGLFSVFYNRKGKGLNITKFLQEWQQKIVLWGGPQVVNAYVSWKNELSDHEPNVQTMESTERLILAIREELGHENANLVKELFPRFILREYKLYSKLSKENPNLTLSELSEHEKNAQQS